VFFCGNDGTITIEEQDPSDHDPRLGTQLGGYIVVARVADGAMGRVYEGRHPQTKERVAVKVLHADVARDMVAIERFKREYETAKELEHPHIVKVLGFDETGDGSWYMTMEYLHGEELGELVRREGALPMERTVRVLCQAALALNHAHAFGVIHRDLKPDNIFLCSSESGDDVRLLDFGSVKLQMETGPKLTAFGTTLGSPYYMSPEQAMGKQDVDGRTDVFALAAILFEMVTGKIAFEGSTVAEILMKIVRENAPVASQANARVPAALDDVIDRGLRKDKVERPGTTDELAQSALAAWGLTGSVEEMGHLSQGELQERLSERAPQPALVSTEVVAPDLAEPSAADPIVSQWPSLAPRLPRSAILPAIAVIAGVLVVAAIAGAIAAYALL